MDLISYGSLSKDFKIMAQLTKLFNKIKNHEIKEYRVDCYEVKSHCSIPLLQSIEDKFKEKELRWSSHLEVFYPSEHYPDHIDEGGISYFIPLESGLFNIGGVSYPVVPFVLYGFEDSNPHNTDFGAIMIK